MPHASTQLSSKLLQHLCKQKLKKIYDDIKRQINCKCSRFADRISLGIMRKILCKKLRPWTNYVASLHVSRFLLGGRIHVEIFTIPLGKTNYASVRMWTVLTQVMMASITEQVGQLADKHELSGLFSNAVPQVLYFTPFISLDLQELTNFVTTIGES